MATVFYKDRDGLTRGFEIAGDTPTASEQARISTVLSGQPLQTQSVQQEDEPGVLGGLGAGVGAGIDQMQAGLYGLAGLAASRHRDRKFLGYSPEEYEKFREEQNAEAASGWRPEGGLSEQQDAGDVARYLAFQFGQSVPATGLGIAGAIATAPMGGIGALAAGSALAGMASLPQSYNENIETQIAQHGKVKDANKAFQAAIVQSGIEGVADRALLGMSGALGGIVPGQVKNLVRDATKGALVKAAQKVGTTTAAGVGTEAVTEAVQQAITRWQAEKPLGGEEAQKEYLENAIVGGILGGAMGGVLGATGAAQDYSQTKKYDAIRKDLDEEDQVSLDNVVDNQKARYRQAEEALAAEEKLAGPSLPLLEDLRSESVGLEGPKTVARPQTLRGKEQATAPTESGQGRTYGELPATNSLFSTEEYVKAVDAMRNEKLVSPDKIKNTMKIGRAKADAIWKTMLERLDAKPAGSNGQYLSVVGKATDGKVEDTPSIKRMYEVRPLADEDVAPFRVVRQGGKPIGPAFKSVEEAYSFADSQQNLGEFAVIEQPKSQGYGVYEVTSGVQGQKPVSRFVKSYNTSQEAQDYANSQNPEFSPESNQIIADNGRVKAVKAKQQEMFGKYNQNVQKLVDQILGEGRTVVDLMDVIADPTGKGSVIEGATQVFNGLSRIQIASAINNPNLSPDQFQQAINSVAHHEVLHAAKAAGLFTPTEWRNLVRRANTRVNGKNYTYLERAQVRTSGAPDGATLEEEAVAEMVRDYMRDPTKFESAPRSLLRRLLDFVRTFGQYAGDVAKGNQTLSAFASGAMAGRPTDTSRAALYGTYYSSVKIPGFYLKSSKFFEEIAEKNPEQAYPGQQWIGMMKGKLPQEELKWVGLEDWLRGQNKVPVKDILQYIAANSVDIQEHVNSDTGGNRRYVNEPDAEGTFTHHHTTKQDGGTEYKEWLFHMPHLDPVFSEPFHFDGFPNIIAFGRTTTRVIDGKKTLFIEEMQSDLHQQGRKKGYTSASDMQRLRDISDEINQLVVQRRRINQEHATATTPEQRAEIEARFQENVKKEGELIDEYNALDAVSKIPEAPLKSNWHEFVVKRLLRYAADNDFEAISWNADAQGVAASEQYPNIRSTQDEEGKDKHEIVWEEGYADTPEIVKDVTGIVNFYTKRLASDVKKLLKPWGIEPTIAEPEAVDQGDLDLESLFPTRDDFVMALNEIQGFTDSNHAARTYRKAVQIVLNQRDFDPQAALDAAQVQTGKMVDDLKEVFPTLEEEMAEGLGGSTVDKNGNPLVPRWMVELTPELKYDAQNKGFSMFSAVQRTPPDTPEFRRWFGGSKVVGDDNKPLTVYHGTLKDFDKFGGGRPDAAVGAGYYFTNEPDDASYNYADPDGPDQIYKMQTATDELLNAGEDVDVDEEGIAPVVRESFQEHGGAVIPVYLAIKNPVVLDGPNSTPLTPENLKDMIKSVKELARDYLNIDPARVAKDIAYAASRKETGAEQMLRALESSGGLMDAIDPESGMEVSREAIRRMWEAAGFDGIVMKGIKRRWPLFENLTDDTTHYIAFRPNQIKSVNNTGSYNPDDNRFMYSAVQPRYSATATMGQRVPQSPPVDKLAEVEAKITYNNIAPMFEKAFGWVTDKTTANKLAEGTVIALQDKMQPLAKLIDRVRANGGFISNETDTYLREQLNSGRIDVRSQEHQKKLFSPLIQAVHKLNVSKTDVDELLKKHPSHVVNGREMSAVQSILNNYDNPKFAMAELYLYAQHAKERNALMRDRNQDLINKRPSQFDHGSGMSDYEADDVLNFIGSKPYASQFSDLSNPNSIRTLYRKVIQSTNDVRVEGGLTPDFRKMPGPDGQPLDRYQDYAPLRGYTDDNPDGEHDELTTAFARTGSGLKILGKEDKNALGRGSTASNLIAHAILQNEEAIIRAERNKVAQTFLNMLTQNMGVTLPGPNGLPNTLSDFAEIVPLTKQQAIYDPKSKRVRMANRTAKLDKDLLIVKHAGLETGIRIKDPKLREALMPESTLGPKGQSALVKGLLRLNRFLAAMRTSYNPEFMLSNFFRDLEGAMLNLSELEMKGLRSSIAKDAIPAVRGVYRSLRESNVNDPWRVEFEEFAARGGKTAFMGLRDLESTIGRIMKELEADPNGSMESIKAKGRAVRDWVEAMNDAVENGIRVSTYRHLKEKLLALAPNPNDPATIERVKNRAAFAAKNLTVNFNMGGQLKPTMNAWYLFFNASLQGSAALVNPLIRSKYVRRLWMSAIAAGALQDIILSTLSPVGEDGEKEYDKIPEQVLQTNMILFNPFSERGYFKIPMPYLFNAAWNAGRATMRGIRGGYSMGETINSVMGTAAESLNPWGGGGHWMNYVFPTVADPFIEVVANKNFMGAPITPPENPYGQGDIPSQRYWNNTSPVYVTVADMLDMATGGDGVFPGLVSFSPNQYEYAFEFLGGGAMSTILRAWDFIAPEVVGGAGRAGKLITGDEVSSNDIPFFRRYVGNITTREDLTGYINKRDEVLTVRNALKDAMKDGDTERYQRIMQDYPEAYRLAAKVNAVETRRKKIGSQIKKIRETKKLTEKEKKDLIEPLKKQQEALVNQANAMMSGL